MKEEIKKIKEQANKIFNLYGEPNCEYLHHKKKHQHSPLVECPVEKEIKQRILEFNK